MNKAEFVIIELILPVLALGCPISVEACWEQ